MKRYGTEFHRGVDAPIQETAYEGLGYQQQGRASWRYVDLETGAAIGNERGTRKAILADLDEFAQERGFARKNPGADDEWMAQYDAWEATRDRMRDEFIEEARARFIKDHIVSVESYGDEVRFTSSLHKATRPGAAYQVTDLEGDEPIGHREYQDLDEALAGLWDVASPRTKGVPPMPNPARQRNPLDYAVVVDGGVRFETGVPVAFEYLRNTERSPHLGSRYQQDIEPAGRYVLLRSSQAEPPRGWEVGEIELRKPLVLAFNAEHGNTAYDEHSWKAQLHRAYGKTGKSLSKRLLQDGYDGIVTVGYDRDGRPSDTMEIVDLRVVQRNPAPIDPDIVGALVSGEYHGTPFEGRVHSVDAYGHADVDVPIGWTHQGRDYSEGIMTDAERLTVVQPRNVGKVAYANEQWTWIRAGGKPWPRYRRNPGERPAFKYRYLGTDDEESVCGCCGRQDLKRVAWLVALDEDGNEIGQPVPYGTTCAGQLLRDAYHVKGKKKPSKGESEKLLEADRDASLREAWARALEQPLPQIPPARIGPNAYGIDMVFIGDEPIHAPEFRWDESPGQYERSVEHARGLWRENKRLAIALQIAKDMGLRDVSTYDIAKISRDATRNPRDVRLRSRIARI